METISRGPGEHREKQHAHFKKTNRRYYFLITFSKGAIRARRLNPTR